jgi:hypothetical protein
VSQASRRARGPGERSSATCVGTHTDVAAEARDVGGERERRGADGRGQPDVVGR